MTEPRSTLFKYTAVRVSELALVSRLFSGGINACALQNIYTGTVYHSMHDLESLTVNSPLRYHLDVVTTPLAGWYFE